jgi:AraC-like DNA-binding protein
MNTTEQLVETLARSETFQKYGRAFTETTGMPLALRTVATWRLPFHDRRKENNFCALIAAKSQTCAACLQLQEKLTLDAMNAPATRTCAYGLCETAVPVKLGAQTIGFLQTGQVMRRKPTEAAFQRASDQARQRGVDIGSRLVKQAYFETPVASPAKLGSVSDLLAIFAEHLAVKSNQLMTQTARVESPIIARAKQFILDNHTENLSLRLVSQAVNTSPFYFCKLFRKCTAVSFTGFVSRIRVEKAKHLLLNPNLRVSEIAFAVGFQSLTHFARMFKRTVGQSPTAYRGNRPTTIDAI